MIGVGVSIREERDKRGDFAKQNVSKGLLDKRSDWVKVAFSDATSVDILNESTTGDRLCIFVKGKTGG
jgi:hypothetical protein